MNGQIPTHFDKGTFTFDPALAEVLTYKKKQNTFDIQKICQLEWKFPISVGGGGGVSTILGIKTKLSYCEYQCQNISKISMTVKKQRLFQS